MPVGLYPQTHNTRPLNACLLEPMIPVITFQNGKYSTSWTGSDPCTAPGLDQLPVWFLRLSAPVIYAPLTRLINMSVSSGLVPRQWKQASIRPIPKVPAPSGHADFRPISITPVLTRLVEKTVVHRFASSIQLFSNRLPLSHSKINMPFGQPAQPQQPSYLSSTISPLSLSLIHMSSL